jgi:hypothetical protein
MLVVATEGQNRPAVAFTRPRIRSLLSKLMLHALDTTTRSGAPSARETARLLEHK